MDSLKKLHPASFKGFPFKTDSEVEDQRGRKKAIHDYPNSKKRFVQDLGEMFPTYIVPAYIDGENFLDDVESFKNILDEEGGGELVLPHLGSLNAVALPYSIDYSHKAIGVVKFSLKFTISDADEVPALAPSKPSDVYQKGDEARLDMQNKFAEQLEPPTSQDSFFTVAGDVLDSVVETVTDATAYVQVLNDKVQNAVRDFQSDIIKIVRDPQELAKKLIYGNIALADGLFATISALYSGTIDNITGTFRKPRASEVLSPVTFKSGVTENGSELSSSDIAIWPSDTANRQQKNNNRNLVVETTRFNGLIFGFEVAANFDYTTSEEIESTIAVLEFAYSSLTQSGDETLFFANDNDFMRIINELRELCYSVLAQKLQQVYVVSETNIKNTSAIVPLSYILYKEITPTPESLQEFSEAMVQLNPDLNPCTFTGDIKFFEANS